MHLENGKVWSLWGESYWRDSELLAIFASKEAAELAQSRLGKHTCSTIYMERVFANANEVPLWEAREEEPGQLQVCEVGSVREMTPERLEQYEKQWPDRAYGYSQENAVARLKDRLKERKEV